MSLQTYFHALVDQLSAGLENGEVLLCALSAEDSDFLRLNQNRIVQAGHVKQIEINLSLINGQRQASVCCCLGGDIDTDLRLLRDWIGNLRTQRAVLEDDPFLLFNTTVQNSETVAPRRLPETTSMINDIISLAEGLDLVGHVASGMIYRGFGNSLGQHNWYCKANFNFDWSLFQKHGKAVKAQYAGFEWDRDSLARKIDAARRDLAILDKPPVGVKPGRYRVFLAPAALSEIVQTMSWGGFGLKSRKTMQTPLIKLARRNASLDECLTMVEHNAQGIGPDFTTEGFIKPAKVMLIDSGKLRDSLVSSRSAQEFGEPVNTNSEYPCALEMSGGNLAEDEVLPALDSGLYINNLWYTNFSDRNDCRITGMTRYACFLVENGRFKAPIDAMRFDESIYHLFGDKLIAFTVEREFIFDTDTYERRSTASLHLPGILADDFCLTL